MQKSRVQIFMPSILHTSECITYSLNENNSDSLIYPRRRQYNMLNLLKYLGSIAIVAVIMLGQVSAFAPNTSTSKIATINVRQHNFQQRTTNNKIQYTTTTNNSALQMMSDQNNKSSLPVFLDPNTKGGAVVLSLLLFIIPIIIYQISIGPLGMDGIVVGRNIGVGFSVFSMLLWGSTYIFRVATKDMTYAKQLKDYEDAVIAKRLEELDEDEVQALVEDIERDTF